MARPHSGTVVIRRESTAALEEYARVPIAFEVSRVFDLTPSPEGPGGFGLCERVLAAPYVKDYDAREGVSPRRLAQNFDMSKWGVFAAHRGGARVGGAIVAFDTPGVEMLEGRRDLAVLWDLRVAPDARGQGVGSALFRAAEAWAVARGCRQIKVETQNVNVPACRFYARQGCALGGVDRFAYPDLPGEVRLLWFKDLAPARPAP